MKFHIYAEGISATEVAEDIFRIHDGMKENTIVNTFGENDCNTVFSVRGRTVLFDFDHYRGKPYTIKLGISEEGCDENYRDRLMRLFLSFKDVYKNHPYYGKNNAPININAVDINDYNFNEVVINFDFGKIDPEVKNAEILMMYFRT